MSESIEIKKSGKPIFLTIIGLIACIGMLAMPELAGKPNGEAMPDFVRFIGRFHPIILHLPIGMVTLALLMEIGALFSRNSSPATRTVMFYAAATSVVAVLAGFLLFQGETDWADSPGANRHLWGGIAFSCCIVLAFLAKAWSDAGASAAWLFRFLLIAGTGVMGFASHDGASLTHGPDYLGKYAPAALKPLLGGKAEAPADQPVAEAMVYQDVVVPMLEAKCWKCHNEEKIKGKFRMDSYELLVKGGKEGEGLIAGNAAKSNILIRTELPVDDDERMPPDEKPGLSADEIAVIKWWINDGAKADLKLADAKAPADIAAIIAKRAPAVSKAAPAKTAAAAPEDGKKREALQASINEIQKTFPGAVQFESQDSNGLTFTAVSMRGKFSDEDFLKLGAVMPDLISIDISASLITDKSLALISPATGLRSLRLSETKITDAGLDAVAKLASLESLNIYGTEITDAGLQKLATLPKLKKLYVWRSKATPAGIEELKKKLPSCAIETGTP